ncbi:MAG: DUF1311 domain-containing protein [Nitrospira sp.]|nr:DUF1311 domain-containing protein [Nitrospira sp.]MBS0193993.1 DUF1311 domain-containing protein [Pseudomonadota bacterium]
MKFLLLLLGLAASDVNTSEASGICPNSHTQADLNDCAAKMAKAADTSLAKFYAAYTKRLSVDQVQLFQSATSDWLRYRESHCRFESSGVLGGSAYSMVFDLCMTSQAQERLRMLRELSKCQEGDLSCPTS